MWTSWTSNLLLSLLEGPSKCSKCRKIGHNVRKCTTPLRNSENEAAEKNRNQAAEGNTSNVKATFDSSSMNKCGLCVDYGHKKRTCRKRMRESEEIDVENVLEHAENEGYLNRNLLESQLSQAY